MKYTFLISFLGILILESCITVNVSGIGGVYQDYDKLSESDKAKIKKLSSFDEVKPGMVYEITGVQLSTELKKRDTSVVTIHTNGCSGDACYPMSTYANYKLATGRDVFVIMTDYGRFQYTMNQHPNFALYGINATYYEEFKQKKYRRLFLKDLLQLKSIKDTEPYIGGFLFFKGDSLIDVHKSLFELN